MNWVDIGINLTNKRFDKDREQLVQRAIEVGVERLIITGTNLHESQKALQLANANPQHLFATAGCHPHDAASLNEADLDALKQLATQAQVVAIGECGLDFNRDFSPRDIQVKVFKQQLELAVATQMPVFLHERDAFDCQYQILKDYMPQLKGGVSHCFTGQVAHLEKYLELGLHIGITGWACDERRGLALYNMLKQIPDDRLMLETDGPYLTPRNLKPKPKSSRNESMYLPHIGGTVATARGQSLQHVANISYTNSCRLFNLKH